MKTRHVSAILAAIVLVLTATAIAPPPAAAGLPAWGTPLTTFEGVPVHYNGQDPTVSRGDSGYGARWQCVELVQRFYYVKGWAHSTHWPAISGANEDAYHMFDPGRQPPGIARHANGQPYLPQPGDVLVFAKWGVWTSGHVAIVTGVANHRIWFDQQNVGTDVRDSLPISGSHTTGYRVSSAYGSTSHILYPPVRGWLHYVGNGGSPSPALPPAPTNVTAVGADSSHIRLTWTDNSGGSASYLVTRYDWSTQRWVQIANLPVGTKSYTDSGLAPATTYQYTVGAHNAAGTSWMSLYASGTTLSTSPPPGPIPTPAHPWIGGCGVQQAGDYPSLTCTGLDLGTMAPYNGVSPYLRVFDLSRGWGAGFRDANGQDAVWLDVTDWEDSVLVIGAIDGAYGQNGWAAQSGDAMEVRLWNPETGQGPALFDFTWP